MVTKYISDNDESYAGNQPKDTARRIVQEF
jgi:hypothetical protein